MNPSCKNCIWADKCAQAEPCEFYDPADTTDEEIEAVDEYEGELRARVIIYDDLVEEQDA